MDILHAFYTSKAWRELAYALKIERGGKCERCGWVAVAKDDFASLIGHHRRELNEKNVHDSLIALNPDNISIICLNCHNKEHHRFGHTKKKVTLVWGSPLSGKTTAVVQMMHRGDIVLDIDAIWQAVTMMPLYDKPDTCKYNVFAIRDTIFDQIHTRYGQWVHAWVIGGYADKYERERTMNALGADEVFCESTKAECLRRRVEGGKPPAWDGYIEEWWRVYERGNTTQP